jgi:hypothetical protein
MVNAICIKFEGYTPKHQFTLKAMDLKDCIKAAKRLGFRHISPNELEKFTNGERELLVLQGITKDSFKKLHKLYRIGCMRTWIR